MIPRSYSRRARRWGWRQDQRDGGPSNFWREERILLLFLCIAAVVVLALSCRVTNQRSIERSAVSTAIEAEFHALQKAALLEQESDASPLTPLAFTPGAPTLTALIYGLDTVQAAEAPTQRRGYGRSAADPTSVKGFLCAAHRLLRGAEMAGVNLVIQNASLVDPLAAELRRPQFRLRMLMEQLRHVGSGPVIAAAASCQDGPSPDAHSAAAAIRRVLNLPGAATRTTGVDGASLDEDSQTKKSLPPSPPPRLRMVDCTARGAGFLWASNGELTVRWNSNEGHAEGDEGPGVASANRIPSLGCVALSNASALSDMIDWSRSRGASDLLGTEGHLRGLLEALRTVSSVEGLVSEYTQPQSKCRTWVDRVALEELHRVVSLTTPEIDQRVEGAHDPSLLDVQPVLIPDEVQLRELCYKVQTSKYSSVVHAIKRNHPGVPDPARFRDMAGATLSRIVEWLTKLIRHRLRELQEGALGFDPAYVVGVAKALRRGPASGVVVGADQAERRLGAAVTVRLPMPPLRRSVLWASFCCRCCGFSEEVALMATGLQQRYSQHALNALSNAQSAAGGSDDGVGGAGMSPLPLLVSNMSEVHVTLEPSCFCPSGRLGMLHDMQATEVSFLDRLRNQIDAPWVADTRITSTPAPPSRGRGQMGLRRGRPVPTTAPSKPQHDVVWIAHTDPGNMEFVTWSVAYNDTKMRSTPGLGEAVNLVRIARCMTEVSNISEIAALLIKRYRPTAIWAPSRFVAQVYERAGLRGVRVVPEPVDTSVWRPAALTEPTAVAAATGTARPPQVCAALTMRGPDDGTAPHTGARQHHAEDAVPPTRMSTWFVLPGAALASGRAWQFGPTKHLPDVAVECCGDAACAVVVSQFKWEGRKGWDVLLRGVVQAFHRDPHRMPTRVVLVLYTQWFYWASYDRDEPRNSSRVYGSLREWWLNASLPVAQLSRLTIVVSCALASEHALAAAFRAADLFVLPTRGEGWGLPVVQAMASGLPAMVTNATGPLDFMDGAIPIPVCGPAPLVGQLEPYAGLFTGEGATLWEPCVDALASLLPDYLEPTSAAAARRRERSQRGRRVVLERYTVEAVAAVVEVEIDRAVATFHQQHTDA